MNDGPQRRVVSVMDVQHLNRNHGFMLLFSTFKF